MGDGTILIRDQQPEKHLIHHTLLHKRSSGKHPNSNRCTRAHPREQHILSFRTTDKPEPCLSNNHNFPCNTISKLHHFTPGKTWPIQQKGDPDRSRHRLSRLRIQAVWPNCRKVVQYSPDGGETTSVVNNSNKRIPEGVYPIIIQSRSLRRPLRILFDY